MPRHLEQQPTALDVQNLMSMNHDAADYAERAYRSWLRGAETVQSQALEYWNAGMQKGLEAMNEIARCQTAAEAFGVQARYASEAMQGIITESQKVIDQLAALTTTPWATSTLQPPEAPAHGARAAAAHDGEATAPRSSHRRSSPSGR